MRTSEHDLAHLAPRAARRERHHAGRLWRRGVLIVFVPGPCGCCNCAGRDTDRDAHTHADGRAHNAPGSGTGGDAAAGTGDAAADAALDAGAPAATDSNVGTAAPSAANSDAVLHPAGRWWRR